MQLTNGKFARRQFLRASAGGATALLLAACSSPAAPAAPPAKPSEAPKPAEAAKPAAAGGAPTTAAKAAEPAQAKAGGKANVSFWYQNVLAEYEEPIRKIIQDEFNEANKDRIELKFEYIADYMRVGATAISAGAGPDIIYTDGPSFPILFAEANQLVALDDYSKSFKWKENMFDWAYLQGVYQDKLISLQQSVETMCLYYNKTMFDKNGWKVPQTRAEYMTLGKEMQKQSIIPFAHGNFAPHWLTVAYNNIGGAENTYKALTGQKKWTDPEFVEGVQFFKELHDQKFQTDGQSITMTSAEARPLFFGQKAAMLWQGTWTLAPLNAPKPEFEWDWAPIGGLSDHQKTNPYQAGSGGSYSMVKTAKSPDAAAEVLNWLYGDKKRAIRLAVTQPGEFVAPLRFEDSDFPSTIDPRHRRLMQVLNTATDEKSYGYHVVASWPNRTLTMLRERWPEVLLGKITPAEFQKLSNDVFEEELKDKKVPPVPPR